jgi:type 2 lantibiotic biosynthesis protein LanM
MSKMPVQTQLEIASRAASVYERLARAGDASESDRRTVEREAETTLEFWSRAYARGNAAAFTRRLGWDQLNQEVVLRGLSNRQVEPEPGVPPDWTCWLSRIFEAASKIQPDLSLDEPLLDGDSFEPGSEPPFLELWVPVLRAARAVLVETARGPVAAATPSARHAFERQLIREIASVAALAMHEHFRRAYPAPQGQPAPPSAPARDAASGTSYREFVRTMLRHGLSDFFLTYPVLARHVAVVAETWVVRTGELLERLEADRTAIARQFNNGQDPGAIVSATPALSDPHDGRRRVVALVFESGLRLVYKPRDVSLERAFNEFLAWAVGRGLEPRHAVREVLACDGYGWVEFVEPEAFESPEEVRRYYRKSGGLICLAHLLRGRDLHMENVVATREGPTLVDLEMLLQPEGAAPFEAAGSTASPSAADGVAQSCLGTGLLTLMQPGPDGEVFDIGGLRGRGRIASSLPKRIWTDLRADSLHFVEETVWSAPTGNRVVLDGVVQRPDQFATEIVSGFVETYRFCLINREAILAPGGGLSIFAGRRTRIVFRNSNQYAIAQHVLAAPRYQRSGAMRSCALDALNRGFSREPARPRLWPVVEEERRALEALEIPRFSVATGETTVRLRGEEPLVRYFTRSGLAAAAECFRQLSEDDLQTECETLTGALTSSLDSRFQASLRSPGRSEDSASILMSYADWIAREAFTIAVDTGRGLSWQAHLHPSVAQRETCEAHGLYDGTIGIGLFFAALAAATGDDRWADAARGATSTVRSFFDERPRDAPSGQESIGAGRGLGSIVYALSWIGEFLEDPSPADLALRVARQISSERIESDDGLDLTGGVAGAILGLLTLYRATGDRSLLDRATLCGERLVHTQVELDEGAAWPTRQERFLTGLAHGAAGIAYALLRLFKETGERSFLTAAARAQRFERSQFSAVHGNWPVIGVSDGGLMSGEVVMNAWCHGAPGIALARALALDVASDDEIRAEIAAAVQATSAQADGSVDHLCCGSLGRAETLLAVGCKLDNPDLVGAAVGIAEQVTFRARERGHFRLSSTGFEYRVFDPGFFRGLSGIGYQLARIAEPSRLPSVLGFEMPRPLPGSTARSSGLGGDHGHG